jgi:hypothetical protein
VYDPQKAMGVKKAPPEERSFDYDAYAPCDPRTLSEQISDDYLPIQFLGSSRLRVRINFEGGPKTGLSSRHEEMLVLYGERYGIEPELIELYGGELALSRGGTDYVFLVQKSLIPFMKAELRSGDAVELYILFGLYDRIQQEVIALMNEFNRID